MINKVMNKIISKIFINSYIGFTMSEGYPSLAKTFVLALENEHSKDLRQAHIYNDQSAIAL